MFLVFRTVAAVMIVRLLTIQKNIGPDQTFETEKLAVIQLAKALVAKLR